MAVKPEEFADLVSGMPEATEGLRFGNVTWFVGKKAFAWERPFSKADIKRFGADTPPSGPIVALSTADMTEKEAVLASGAKGVFDIAHFKGFPAVLVQLDVVPKKVLRELIEDAWAACAPAALADEYMNKPRRRTR